MINKWVEGYKNHRFRHSLWLSQSKDRIVTKISFEEVWALIRILKL